MTDISAALVRAREQLARGEVQSAQREAESLAKIASDAPQRAQAHLVVAACAQRVQDYAKGLSHARTAIDLDASDAVAYYLIAELLEATGDARGAVTNVERAVAVNPAFVQAWFYLGILRGEHGDARGAAQAFESTVRLDPRHARAWNNLGNALRNLSRLDDARHAFAQAV